MSFTKFIFLEDENLCNCQCMTSNFCKGHQYQTNGMGFIHLMFNIPRYLVVKRWHKIIMSNRILQMHQPFPMCYHWQCNYIDWMPKKIMCDSVSCISNSTRYWWIIYLINTRFSIQVTPFIQNEQWQMLYCSLHKNNFKMVDIHVHVHCISSAHWIVYVQWSEFYQRLLCFRFIYYWIVNQWLVF